jgi:hypothetical protein
MIRRERELRLSAAQVLEHLLFWPHERRFEFLCDVGSERDVGSGAANAQAVLPPSLAAGSSGGALHWDQQLDAQLVEEKTSKGQHYKYGQTTELLRFMRNVRQHPPLVGSAAEAALLLAPAAKEGSGEWGASDTIATYFLSRYPHLLIRVYQAVLRAGWADRPSLAKYMSANNATAGIGAPSDSEHAAATVVRAVVASTEEGVVAEVVDAEPPSSWSADDVGAWLAGIGGAYSGYSAAFIENGIDGGELLSEDFGLDELMEFGVSSKVHQKRIVREIKKLK